MPYWNFATSGFSDMKVKSLRFMVYGSGTIRAQKMVISTIRSTNTYRHNLVSPNASQAGKYSCGKDRNVDERGHRCWIKAASVAIGFPTVVSKAIKVARSKLQKDRNLLGCSRGSCWRWDDVR